MFKLWAFSTCTQLDTIDAVLMQIFNTVRSEVLINTFNVGYKYWRSNQRYRSKSPTTIDLCTLTIFCVLNLNRSLVFKPTSVNYYSSHTFCVLVAFSGHYRISVLPTHGMACHSSCRRLSCRLSFAHCSYQGTLTALLPWQRFLYSLIYFLHRL